MKIIDRINNSIPESVRSLVGFASNLTGFLVAAGTIVYTVGLFIYNYISGGQLRIDVLSVTILIILAVLLIISIINSDSQRRKYLRKQKLITRYYYTSVREYKNFINEIEKIYKNETDKLTYYLLYEKVSNFVQLILENLTSTMETFSGQEVSACVKNIVGGDYTKIDYEVARVKTFVRSRDSLSARTSLDQKRESTDGDAISANTDFYSIIMGEQTWNDDVFYQSDLLKFKEECRKNHKSYDNSTPNWWEYYRSTIVVPIRISNELLHYTVETKGYYTLGFLCVDSKSDKAFSDEENQKRTNIQVMKAYSALLFNVMSKYQYYNDQITRASQSTAASQSKDAETTEQIVSGDNCADEGANAQSNLSKRQKGRQTGRVPWKKA